MAVFSRDFTYIDNVIEANIRSLLVDNSEAVNTVYNVAYGERTTLTELLDLLKKYLSEFDSKIRDVKIIHGPERKR